MHLAHARFDWYQTTVHVDDPERSGLVSCLMEAWDLVDWVPAKPLNGYNRGGAIVRGDKTLCRLCWGGQPGVNCLSTSEESPVLSRALMLSGFAHRPTRVDACLDWDEPFLFDILSEKIIQYALKNRITIDQQGDWTRLKGRTLYLGAKSSALQLVLYEKGYEQGGGASLDWVRLEVRVRPKGERRAQVSSFSPTQIMCSGFAHSVLKHIGIETLHEKASVGSIWRREDDDRARAVLLKQYRAIMRRWANEVGGWEQLGKVFSNDSFHKQPVS